MDTMIIFVKLSFNRNEFYGFNLF